MNKLNFYHNHLHNHVGFIGNAELIVYMHEDVYIHPRLTKTTWKIYATMYVFLFLKIIFLLVVICACKIFHIKLCFRKGRTCRNKLSQFSVFNKSGADRGPWAWVVSLVTIIKPVAVNYNPSDRKSIDCNV